METKEGFILRKIGSISYPELNATGGISIGSIDIEQTRITRPQPSNLGYIAIIRELRDLPTLQIN